ncbi:MAG: HlyC/CorC family transporter [Planctomycetes bacterium]|nr:HlyC/CorC family transporter [Planctomycetota bacterium]
MITSFLLLALLLCCSAILSGSETELFSLSKYQLGQFRNSSHRLQRMVARLMSDPRKVLLTILMGNTTVNVLIFASSYAISEHLGEINPVLASVWGLVTVILVIVIGEVLAKTFAISVASTIAPPVALLIGALQTVLTPLRVVLEYLVVVPISRLLVGGPDRGPREVTVEELKALVDLDEYSDAIAPRENDMLQEVVALASTRVASIMIPRVDIAAFDLADGRDELLAMLRTRRHTRIPVYEGDVDHITGLIHARDLYLNADVPLAKLAQPVGFVPEQMTADKLLAHFRDSKTQFAIVVDEFGGVAGLVTMKDVVEQIVGDIEQPHDQAVLVEQIGPRSFRMAGQVNIQPWYEAFGIVHPDYRILTLGGLVTAKLGRLPREGDQLHIGEARLTVEQMKGKRVQRVRVELDGGQEAEE